MLLSLIIAFAFELKWKLLYFVLSLLSIFLNTKTNVVMNLKPLIWVNNSISLLILGLVDSEGSVSLNCSSGLKEFKVSTL